MKAASTVPQRRWEPPLEVVWPCKKPLFSRHLYIKGYNTLSYPKLHVEFEYNNLLEPILTWETVLRVHVIVM